MRLRERLGRSIVSVQDRLAALVGCTPAAREAIITGMLRRDAQESTAYWLQLLVAVGIATLGLVLGSTAVIIGAMLIAPLMGPIVGLGMGLAIGSPLLVLRAAGRIVASVVVAIGTSALITTALPFLELNQEILARTAPTVLDLLTAAFCALAGAFAAMRPSSDVASTAAGTSIGIALVPPLCASGIGVGTGAVTVASGAALLFLANFVAIIVVGMVAFVAVGFNQVNTLAREEAGLDGGLTRGASRWLAHVFASRGGAWLRALMPLALLALVYLPLREALDEVAWQIRARREVARAVAGVPFRVVQSRVHVERGGIELVLVLLGDGAAAERARESLTSALRGAARLAPRVEVIAVPDAAAFAGLEAALRPTIAPAAPPDPAAEVAAGRAALRATLDRRWPRDAAGPLLDVIVGVASPQLRLELVHLGPPIGPAAREALRRSLDGDLGGSLELDVIALPPGDLTTLSDAELWPLVDRARGIAALRLCIEEAPPTWLGRLGLRDAAGVRVEALRARLGEHPGVQVTGGSRWAAHFTVEPCPEIAAPPASSDAARLLP